MGGRNLQKRIKMPLPSKKNSSIHFEHVKTTSNNGEPYYQTHEMAFLEVSYGNNTPKPDKSFAHISHRSRLNTCTSMGVLATEMNCDVGHSDGSRLLICKLFTTSDTEKSATKYT